MNQIKDVNSLNQTYCDFCQRLYPQKTTRCFMKAPPADMPPMPGAYLVTICEHCVKKARDAMKAELSEAAKS